MQARYTSGLRGDDRGQTLQDFAIGIGIFLLVFIFVTTQFPEFIGPLQPSVEGSEYAESERVSEQMVTDLSIPGRPNTLNATRVTDLLDDDSSTVRQRFDVPRSTFINISVQSLDGSEILSSGGTLLASGGTPGDQAAATSSRVVQVDSVCPEPACRLVVTVW